MPGLTFDQVSKEFPGGTVAVRDLSLAIADGEFMIFVGPSGCGKTTALRMVAGLEKITSGTISIGDRVINDDSPRDRDIAMVFQNYALYPHMTVYKNLAFGLKERKMPKDEIAIRVNGVSSMLGIDDLLTRRPAQLSGGQRQRVAMGRALVREPEAFLLDEPLSNLDAKLRVQMRGDLKRLHQRLGITTIYVTHDQVEAMTLGDRVAVMSRRRAPAARRAAGRLRPPGEPVRRRLHRQPADEPAARRGARAASPTPGISRCPIAGVPERRRRPWGLRPEHLRPATDGQPSMEFQVEVVEPLGDGVIVHGTVSGTLVTAPSGDDEVLPRLAGERAEIATKFEPTLCPSPGERMRLAIAPHHVHVFDGRTGDVIVAAGA